MCLAICLGADECFAAQPVDEAIALGWVMLDTVSDVAEFTMAGTRYLAQVVTHERFEGCCCALDASRLWDQSTDQEDRRAIETARTLTQSLMCAVNKIANLHNPVLLMFRDGDQSKAATERQMRSDDIAALRDAMASAWIGPIRIRPV